MPELAQLGAVDLRQVIETFGTALAEHRESINQLNVYPVPDGDTGTNMALTLRSVLEEIDGVDAANLTMESVCGAISHGSLMGARGNSGVIMSQILRGLAAELGKADLVGADDVVRGFSVAATAAYGAVGNPVEGTILTVVREMAEAGSAAHEAEATMSLVAVLEVMRAEGYASLERTPDLLPVLKQAGVVDAGGRGLLLLVDALLNVVNDRPLPEPETVAADLHALAAAEAERPDDHGTNIADLRYEVMFLLDAPDDRIDEFKATWLAIGDSIVVVGGDGIYNCHIHSDDIGASIEAGIAVGRPHQIRVTDLLEELEHREELIADGPGEAEPQIVINATDPVVTGVVAVGVGSGVREIFSSLGVQAMVVGGQTMNPSTQLLLDAVNQIAADEVVLLPNNKNIIGVAEQVDSQSAKPVRVVPTRSIAEGFAALMAYDPKSAAESNATSMVDAADAVSTGEITQAVRDTDTDAGPVKAGDWLGIVDGKIVAVAPDMAKLAEQLMGHMVTDDSEIVTLICGEGSSGTITGRIETWLGEHRPDAELEVHQGGQPLYPYYVGVE